MTLDYAVYGRQIALPEVGAHGQRALATTSVRFAGDPETAALAAAMHARAGGRVAASDADVTVTLPAHPLRRDDDADSDVARLGVAAWAAVEAARRVLGLGLACNAPPDALLERLALEGTAR